MNFVSYSRTPNLQRIYERLVLKHQCEGFSLKSCKHDSLNVFNSIRKILQHRYFSVSFVKFLGNLFRRTPLSNYFSHDAVFSLFADQRGLHSKNQFVWWSNGNQEKEFTSPFNAVQLQKPGRNFVVKLWPHIYRLRH